MFLQIASVVSPTNGLVGYTSPDPRNKKKLGLEYIRMSVSQEAVQIIRC